MFFSSRSKLIANFRGIEQIFTRYGRLSSFFSWSLHVYKGSSVENGARGRWDDLFWVYLLHILGDLLCFGAGSGSYTSWAVQRMKCSEVYRYGCMRYFL